MATERAGLPVKRTEPLSHRRHYVDFHKPDDFDCALYAAYGMSTDFIVRKTGLSPGQVSYRLRKASIKRKSVRNGDGYMEDVIRQSRGVMARALRTDLDTIRSANSNRK